MTNDEFADEMNGFIQEGQTRRYRCSHTLDNGDSAWSPMVIVLDGVYPWECSLCGFIAKSVGAVPENHSAGEEILPHARFVSVVPGTFNGNWKP